MHGEAVELKFPLLKMVCNISQMSKAEYPEKVSKQKLHHVKLSVFHIDFSKVNAV